MPANLSNIVAVEGIEEACQWLDEVSSIIATRAYVNGFDAAGEVLEAALWPLVPVDLREEVLKNRAHGGHGPLVSNLKREIEVDARGRGGLMEIGFGNLGHLALWLNDGHQIVKGGRLTNWKKKGTGRVTGFVQGTKFMQRAFDQSQARAIDAFVEGMKRTLKGVPGYSEAA
jgi:hypothetical protein